MSVESAAEDVMRGHRERTLAFLWRVILHFQVGLGFVPYYYIARLLSHVLHITIAR